MSSEAAVLAEEKALEQEIKSIQEWWGTSRFKHTKRPYSAKNVAVLRGTISTKPMSAFTSTKLYNMVRASFEKGQFNHTFGALDPVQVIQVCYHIFFVFCCFTCACLSDFIFSQIPTKTFFSHLFCFFLHE